MLEEEDQRQAFREDRKEILRRTERLIARESEERQRWDKVLNFLKENFDLSPEVVLAATSNTPTPSSTPVHNTDNSRYG